MQPPAQELMAKDLHDSAWTFRHIYRGSSLFKTFSFSSQFFFNDICSIVNHLLLECIILEKLFLLALLTFPCVYYHFLPLEFL